MDPRRKKRFDLFLGALARSLSGDGLVCEEIAPASSGDLRFRFTAREGSIGLTLKNAGGAPAGVVSRDFMGQALLAEGDGGPDLLRRTLVRAKAKLDRICSDKYCRKWVTRRNSRIKELRLTKGGLLALLGGVIVPNEPFWGSWFVDKVTRDRGGKDCPAFRISLKDGARRELEMLFSPSGIRSEDGRYLIEHRAARLLLSSDTRSEEERLSASGAPEAAFSYLLARGIPEGFRWLIAGDAEKPGKPAEDPSSGLTESCLKGYMTEGSERRSRFFGVWGELEQFSAMAAFSIFRERTLAFHADRECEFSDVALRGHPSSLVGYPSPWSLDSPGESLDPDGILMTGLDDASIIYGTEDRLAEAIGRAREAHPDRGVCVIGQCACCMIGDDISSVCARTDSTGSKVRYLNPPGGDFSKDKSINWWHDLFDSMREAGAGVEKRSVNLAGIGRHGDGRVAELKGLLARMGVETAAVILPDASPDARERFHRAELTVLSRWQPARTLLDPVFKERGIRFAALGAPYGVEGTTAWLNAVAGLVGAPGIDAKTAAEWAAERAPDFDSLKRRAEGINVGLLADMGSLEELCSPEFFFGFDPCAFLGSLGFSVTVLRLDGAPAGSESLRRRHPRVRFAAADGERGLRDIVGKFKLDLVYCDVCDGRIVKSAGAVPFGIDALSMGYSGARESLRRLLALAGMTVYRRFSGALEDR